MTERTPSPETAMHRLRWPLRLTWMGLLAERLTQSFWPVWSLLLFLAAIFSFGFQDYLPVEVAWGGLVLCLGGALWYLAIGLRGFRWPRREEAIDRLDRTMPGRPISALRDSQALGAGDAASAEVWRAHVDRMALRAAEARAPEPDLRLARRDPFALRYVALLAFVLAIGFGSLWRITDFGTGAPGATAAAAGPTWEGWVQPPAYTGKPAVYLNDVASDDLTVPAGSKLTLRLYGKVGALTVAETISGRTGLVDSASDPEQSFEIRHSGKLGIEGRGGHDWDVTVTPDQPPQVALTGKLDRAADGKMRLPFHASDDYGVTSGTATITLDLAAVDRRYGLAAVPEPRKPIVLDLPMPISGSRADFTQTLVDDLSKEAWANLPVKIALSVKDAAGHVATTTAGPVELPGRRFFDPLASAVIEMRRDLLWSRANAARADEILRAVTWHPEGFIQNTAAYLQLRVAMKQLEEGMQAGLTPATRDEVAETLWKVAVQLEDGTLSNALQRLRESQDRLSEAIRRGASKDEIAKLMQQMNDALQNYVARLAQEQQNDPNRRQAQAQPSMTIDGQQMQQLLDRLQQLMEQGKTAEAQALLDRLRQLTENMQIAQGQGGMQVPGRQAMQGLSDTLRQQQDLSDQAFQNMQRQYGQQGQYGQGRQNGGQQYGDQPGGQQEGQQGQGGPSGQRDGGALDGKALADRQQALRRQLDMLRGQGLPGDGTADGKTGRQALDRAGKAMDQAEQALRDNDLAGALDKQAEAMDAMRDGLHSMEQAMTRTDRRFASRQGEGRGQGPQGRPDSNDPLGRPTGQSYDGKGQEMLKGEDVYRRAREILDEIRKRAGDENRSAQERDYLKRLLDLF